MNAFWSKHGEWMRWGAMVICVIALRLADGRYVSQSAYTADRDLTAESFQTIQTALRLQEDKIQMLADHENRLRKLEHKAYSSLAPVIDPPQLATVSALQFYPGQ